MRILIADDHVVVRQGLQHILSKTYAGATFGEAQTATEVLHHLRQQAWDVVLLDINMPGRSGLEVLKDIKQEYPQLPILVLSMHPEEQYAVRTLKAGASGYLTKEAAIEELADAVQRVLEGRHYISPAVAEELAAELDSTQANAPKLPHEHLSDREYQVLCHLAAGKKLQDIAAELCVSAQTVSTYRNRIIEKMHMKTTADLIRYALKNDLNSPG